MISVSGNLNAKDNVYVPKAYSEKLDELIEDPNTNNIAVTAPYDSGKTTMLKSYLKNKENIKIVSEIANLNYLESKKVLESKTAVLIYIVSARPQKKGEII